MDQPTAHIFNIQPLSTEDGPGIRTTVFMKGCSLRCAWCQNPEGLTAQAHLVHEPLRCIGCGACRERCPQGAISGGGSSGEGLQFSDACRRCLSCAEHCPAAAIRVIGERISLPDLIVRLLRDKPFYATSGGGVTFSGGECLLQPELLQQAIPLLKAEGVHVCIDTAGHVEPELFRKTVRLADLVLYDLKIMDPGRHRELTGAFNESILANAAWLGASRIPTWVRVPVVPGYTDDEANITAIACFIRERMDSVERVDLLGYNDLCAADYEKLQLPYTLPGAARIAEKEMLRLRRIMAQSGAARVTISNYLKGA
jgi:pyruvate formate lyase activating enzyme